MNLIKYTFIFIVLYTSEIQHLFAQQKTGNLSSGNYSLIEQEAKKNIAYWASIKRDQLNTKSQFQYYKYTIENHEILGKCYLAQGDINKTEAEFLLADSIYFEFIKKNFYYSSRDLGSGLNKNEQYKNKQHELYYNRQLFLAELYMNIGEFKKSKSIIENVDKKNKFEDNKHSVLSKKTYLTVANYYLLKHQYDSSIYFYTNYIKSIRSDERYVDNSFNALSNAYVGLAQAYLANNQNTEALKAAKKAASYNKHRFNTLTKKTNVITNIKIYNTLAEAYRVNLNYSKATKWNNIAYSTYQTEVKIKGPYLLPVLATRGKLFWTATDKTKSMETFAELSNVFFDYIHKNFSLLSESERIFFYRNNKEYVELLKGFYGFWYFEMNDKDPDIFSALYEININSKGILLNESSKIANKVFTSNDSTLINQYLALKSLHRKKSFLIEKGDLKTIESLEIEISTQEKAIRKSLSIEEEVYLKQSDITKNIEKGTILIDVLKTPTYSLKYVKLQKDSIRSLALDSSGAYVYFTGDSKNFSLTKNEHSAKLLETKHYKKYYNSIKFSITDTSSYYNYWPKISDKSTKKIIFSADGIYNLINPDQLYNGKDYLIDTYTITSVLSSKDILQEKLLSFPIQKVTLIGNPNFDTHENYYSEIPVDLPGTKTEIESIVRILPTDVTKYIYMGDSATEYRVKNLSSTSIIHFATHGYFESTSDLDALNTTGLIFAINDSTKIIENGYLSAYEASNLELKNTSLVVLSACETGQGVFEGGEGVWGLQRAFQIAGVRFVIMSLYKVDDHITSELMTQFYKNLVNKLSVSDAFHLAELQIKNKYNKPKEWGAFILKGY